MALIFVNVLGLEGSPVEATGVEVLEITKRDARIKISGSTST